MKTHIFALALLASVASTGIAQAQTPTPAPMPGMTMTMPAMPASSFSMTGTEIVTVGVGAVAGAVLFHATMIHGMTLVGAVVGGWLGEMYYGHHVAPKPAT